ncbi:MAG TPA: C13 family peptidase [Gemmatimonadaceae bacterium]|nr:C13 family peptidase [Gemmatimonadaceae bacterium]
MSPAIEWLRIAAVAGAALLLGGTPQASPAQAVPQTHVLFITGASGEPRFATAFHAQVMALRAAATGAGIPDSLILYLAEDPSREPRAITGRSNREGVTQAIERIAGRAGPDDQVLILLIGHGSADNEVSRFNAPGADLTDADFAKLLDRLSRQSVAFVNAASASGDFIKTLSGPNRVVVTATKSGFERNETLFGEHFVAAYAKEGADTDKDGRVSLLEAFTYARREVTRAYEQSNRLQTEHAMLDDDGDGVGRADPAADGPDGRRARGFFLGAAGGLPAGVASDPRAAALLATQRQLQQQIDSLRVVKSSMPEAEYEKQLEALLLKLAETTRALRALEVRKP